MTKVRLYALGTSTTLESNKSAIGIPSLRVKKTGRKRSLHAGVYYGSRQPLSLITALGCLTLAKTALRRLTPARGTFFWP